MFQLIPQYFFMHSFGQRRKNGPFTKSRKHDHAIPTTPQEWRLSLRFCGALLALNSTADHYPCDSFPMPVLYSIRFSPWTLKAKWALAHYDAQHTNKEFLSGVTDAILRWKTKNFCGRLTVPILIGEGGVVLTESFEIAQWAGLNKGPNCQGGDLFDGVDADVMKQWNQRSDEILNYSRSLALQGMMNNGDATKQTLPKLLQNSLGVMIAKRFLRKLTKKYENEPGTNSKENARECLVVLREALAKSGGEYITGSFSYADIVMVIALLAVYPFNGVMPAFPEFQEAFTVPGFSEEFADLVEWGKKIVAKHHHAGSTTGAKD
ncbi:hypothetical protein BSKO_04164 [Bryopsis sp. KO-2023]|nr:hypothetical protein BSKO_04164 [Bryopsis sp. KO-2023]